MTLASNSSVTISLEKVNDTCLSSIFIHWLWSSSLESCTPFWNKALNLHFRDHHHAAHHPFPQALHGNSCCLKSFSSIQKYSPTLYCTYKAYNLIDSETRDIIHSLMFHYNKDMVGWGREQLKEWTEHPSLNLMILKYDEDMVEGGKEQMKRLAECDIHKMILKYDQDMKEESKKWLKKLLNCVKIKGTVSLWCSRTGQGVLRLRMIWSRIELCCSLLCICLSCNEAATQPFTSFWKTLYCMDSWWFLRSSDCLRNL